MQSSPNLGAILTYLDLIEFPSLEPEETEALSALITKEELTRAIDRLKTAKSPGSDGLRAEFYRQFAPLLMDRLLEVYNEALEKGFLPQ